VPLPLFKFDKVLVFIVQVATLVLLLFLGRATFSFSSYFFYLSSIRSFPSKFSCGARAMLGSEVSNWHGAGIGMGSTLFLQTGAGLGLHVKGLLWVCLVALLA